MMAPALLATVPALADASAAMAIALMLPLKPK